MRLQEHWLHIKIDSAFQLGFSEWGEFLHDPHLTAALLDRITVNCVVFNMKECNGIRDKNILYATNGKASPEAAEAPDGS